MRGLSALELRELVELIDESEYTVEFDDPIVASWQACFDRGLATCALEDDGCLRWDANDLGRLALRVHQAANS